MKAYFVHQIKHNKINDSWDKGIVIKNTEAEALQAYHAYLGAYGYGHDETIDYVFCELNMVGHLREPLQEEWEDN